MNEALPLAPAYRIQAVEDWYTTLRDRQALLSAPETHFRRLKLQAYGLHQAQTIDRDDLCEMLELADSALAYALEELLGGRR